LYLGVGVSGVGDLESLAHEEKVLMYEKKHFYPGLCQKSPP